VRVCVIAEPWLLRPGTFGPSNRLVDVQSDFTLHCMTADRRRAADTHWYVYFVLASVHCHLYPPDVANCSTPYNTSRFSVRRVHYMLALHVRRASVSDTGLYACSRPAYFYRRRPTAHVAFLAIIRTPKSRRRRRLDRFRRAGFSWWDAWGPAE